MIRVLLITSLGAMATAWGVHVCLGYASTLNSSCFVATSFVATQSHSRTTHPQQITAASFGYQPSSMRVKRWFVHGQSFPDPIALVDLTDAGDVDAGQEERLYYLKDALGSVVALADDAGQVVERYVYTPYGRTMVLGSDGAEALPPLGTSYYYDADLDADVDDEDMDHILGCIG
ncbi:MAG: hypothetical protein KAV82_14025, partial [Phycisphaerae bacterium]|nr:hypothetical protein [Phycisphaerae bacterium]